MTTRQRGNADTLLDENPNLWNYFSIIPRNTLPAPGGNVRINKALGHSLGYLNAPFCYGTAPFTTMNPGWLTTNDVATSQSEYVGDPKRPFPWLTRNNRPYSNAMELLYVPACSASRLSLEFTMPASAPPAAGAPPPLYTGANSYVSAQYGHLLGFFHSEKETGGAMGGNSADLARIFEYVEVPSRFVGTETYLNPNQFVNVINGPPTELDTLTFLHPPFNKISNFRNPGLININTLQSPYIWTSMLNMIGVGAVSAPYNYLPIFPDIMMSRNGTAQPGPVYHAPAMGASLPCEFINPFRSAACADLVPLDEMRHRGINVTLLRARVRTRPIPTIRLCCGANIRNGTPNAAARLENQPVLHLSAARQAGQHLDHALQRLRDLDHGGLLRSQSSRGGCGAPGWLRTDAGAGDGYRRNYSAPGVLYL